MWRRVGAGLVALALAQGGVSAQAAEMEVMPDRPDHATSLDTVPPGMAQFESGLVFLRDASGDPPVRRLKAEASLRLGLAERFEIEATSDLFLRERGEGQGTSGVGDTALAVKWRLLDAEGWRPGFGLLPFVKLPTASRAKGLGSGRIDFGGIFLIGQDLPAELHVDLNVGLAAISLAARPRGFFLEKSAAASFSWVGSSWVVPFWEIFYEGRDRPAGNHSVGTDFGLVFILHRRVALDVAGEVGLSGNAADWALRAGFTLLLGAFDDGGRETLRRRPGPRAVAEGAIDTRGWSAYHAFVGSPSGVGGRR